MSHGIAYRLAVGLAALALSFVARAEAGDGIVFAGSGTFRPYLNIEERYDSAAAFAATSKTGNPDSDLITHIRPGFNLLLSKDIGEFGLNANLDWAQYASATELSRLFGAATLAFGTNRHSEVGIELFDEFRRSDRTSTLSLMYGAISDVQRPGLRGPVEAGRRRHHGLGGRPVDRRGVRGLPERHVLRAGAALQHDEHLEDVVPGVPRERAGPLEVPPAHSGPVRPRLRDPAPERHDALPAGEPPRGADRSHRPHHALPLRDHQGRLRRHPRLHRQVLRDGARERQPGLDLPAGHERGRRVPALDGLGSGASVRRLLVPPALRGRPREVRRPVLVPADRLLRPARVQRRVEHDHGRRDHRAEVRRRRHEVAASRGRVRLQLPLRLGGQELPRRDVQRAGGDGPQRPGLSRTWTTRSRRSTSARTSSTDVRSREVGPGAARREPRRALSG